MALDIRGGLKNTRISENQYVVFDELLSNSIDSYLIRKNQYDDVDRLNVVIDIEFTDSDLISDGNKEVDIRCEDNGAGLGDDQTRAFVTKDSTYKDDLKIPGIGKCKGSGRVQFFHFFKSLSIKSVYNSGINKKLRSIKVLENTKEIAFDDFKIAAVDNDIDYSTIVYLVGLKESARNRHFFDKSIVAEYSAKAVRDHIFRSFLQRFILLRDQLGDFKITISSKDDVATESEIITSEELPEISEPVELAATCIHEKEVAPNQELLKIYHYSFSSDIYHTFENDVALCANNSIVLSIVKNYLKSITDRKRPIDNKFHLVLIQGEYLEDRVNVQRDNFNIPKSCVNTDAFYSAAISLEDIYESIEDYIFGIFTPPDFNRDALIESTNNKYGISKSMIAESRVKIHFNDTEEKVAKRVLAGIQKQVIEDTAEIFDMKQELLMLDPKGDEFREKVNKLSWVYTSNIKKIDMANLSQLVVRRAAMLEVLNLAVNDSLLVQSEEVKRKENERVIHNIFFPTGKDSNDQIDHDIWILSEEYHYFKHIASDKPLSTIPWSNNEKLFEADIDANLEKLFAQNNNQNSRKRPDIAIFNQEGSAIIIEFKSPGIELQDHTNDLMEYAVLLAAKSNGKINKFYGYLIGTDINPNRVMGYTRFASGKGWFGTHDVRDHKTNNIYGELYSEILFYGDIVDKANKRLSIYREKLNIDLYNN